MKVSYNWLQEYFEETLPIPEKLAETLTLHSFEIEGIEAVGDDFVIDVDVLPNRSSDALSHRGIAREIATLLSLEMLYDPLSEDTLEIAESTEFKVEVEDNKLCSRYALGVIKGVKVGPSPLKLKNYLEALGQRSINNIVDATNYVMLNTGQPLHAFDADKLEGKDDKTIKIRRAKKGEKITTLTDDEFELDAETLLIVDGNSDKPIGIAGVKGGKKAEVDEKTRTIAIESAHFDSGSIRKTAKKLKLWTDASVRFQNNPSQHLVGYALADVIELILDIAGGEVEGAVDICVPEEDKEPVKVTLEQINNLLGKELAVSDVVGIFEKFDFEFETEGEEFTVTPPFERTDLNIYEDLIEEVGRVYGYEHLEAKKLPPLNKEVDINKEFAYADKIRNILTKAGYSEVIGYTLQEKGDYEAVSSVAEDKAYLRTDLRKGMDLYIDKNSKNAPLFGLERVKLFEFGRVFPKSGEYVSFAFGISGKKVDKLLAETKELLGNELNKKIEAGIKDGIVELNFSKFIDSLPTPKEYDKFSQNLTQYEDFSTYPFVLRDIALFVPEKTKEDKIVEIINETGTDLLLKCTKFDEFKKEGRVSFAYHLVFQSMERTLTDEEINTIMENITSKLNEKDGFEVR